MSAKQKQQTIMFIKVTFKKVTFNLGKDIKTYTNLIDQTKARFSELKSFKFFFDEQPITDYNFSTIMKLQGVKGEKSLKIQLRQSEQQKIEKLKPNKTKTYSFNSDEQSKIQKFSFNLDDFEDQEKNMKANEQLQDIFQVLTLGDKVQSQQQVLSNLSKIKIKVAIENESESIKTKIGNEYYWTCHLINESEFQISDKLYVQDLTTKKFIEIYEMKVNDSRQMVFGPYIENQVGKYTHFYQIVLKKDSNMTYPVGKKFGFVCEVSKKLPVKSIENKMFSKINLLKCFSECEKSTQYIIKKLKQLSIDEDSIDNFEDQNLIEIIESIGEK